MKIKPKLTPSWDIYNRIIWDERLDAGAFVIGYSDRMAEGGMKEKLLLEWDAQGDIPWHRVQYFRCGELRVWDREARIDLFDSDELPEAAWANRQAPALQYNAEFPPRPVYAFGQTDWQPCRIKPGSGLSLPHLRVVTWNILCDLFEKERICSEQRLPVIVQQLLDSDADIIALQEVSGSVCKWLQAQPWVQENYYLSDLYTAQALYPHGTLLLSKHPFTLVEHRFSEHKRFLLASFTINQQVLHVGVVHLTSNRSSGAGEKRRAQLQTIVDYCQNLEGEVLLLGDFNDREGETATFLADYQWFDYWKRLHPEQAGYTFDVERNDFARLFSLSGQPGRLDYIFGRGRRWQGQAMALLATEPFEGEQGQRLFASDHYALCLDLNWQSDQQELLLKLTQTTPTYQTAVVLIPPTKQQPPIQALRRQFDTKYPRWMPHITLLYGFLPEELLAQAAQVLVPIAQQFQPQDIELEGYGYFQHRNKLSAWLRPVTDPADWLKQLQAALQGVFPNCSEQGSRPMGFQPHLSIGQFPDQATAERRLPVWKPLRFEAAELAIIARKGDQPFQLIYSIAFATGQVQVHHPWQAALHCWMPQPDEAQQTQRQWALSLVEDACAQVLGQRVALALIGSARLGTIAQDSDIDCLCPLPLGHSIADFLQAVAQVLTPFVEQCRAVLDAQVPILKLNLSGIAIDLLAAEYPHFPQPIAAQPHSAADFPPLSWQALGGVLEAQYLEALFAPSGRLDDFRIFVRLVKAWARARSLTGNGWGWLGSYSWTVLAAYTWQDYHQKQATSDIEACLAHFFRLLVGWDGAQPLSLSAEGRAYVPHPLRDRMPIVTSIAPCFNSARNITASTARVLRSEWQRAAACFSERGADWERLFEAATFDYPHHYHLTVEADTAAQAAQAWGWIEGNFIGLLLQLEQETGQALRPLYRQGEGLWLYAEQPPAADSQALAAFGERLGVGRLRWIRG